MMQLYRGHGFHTTTRPLFILLEAGNMCRGRAFLYIERQPNTIVNLCYIHLQVLQIILRMKNIAACSFFWMVCPKVLINSTVGCFLCSLQYHYKKSSLQCNTTTSNIADFVKCFVKIYYNYTVMFQPANIKHNFTYVFSTVFLSPKFKNCYSTCSSLFFIGMVQKPILNDFLDFSVYSPRIVTA